MRSFRADPYLWVHLAGFAAVPIWLELCFLGFAVGDPLLPPWLEVFLVGAIGIAPIAWMQWQRPFYIFSLLAVALKPEQLTLEQRQMLTLFQLGRTRIITIAVAIALFLGLQTLYVLSPIAATIAPFSADSRLLGLGLAAIAFLGANLFCQVPASVLGVMLTRAPAFAATPACDVEHIRQSFTRLGVPLNQVLPIIIAEPAPNSSVAGGGGISSAAAIETVAPAPIPAEFNLATVEPETTDLAATDRASADLPITDQALADPPTLDEAVTDSVTTDPTTAGFATTVIAPAAVQPDNQPVAPLPPVETPSIAPSEEDIWEDSLDVSVDDETPD
jgi:hypothetical protein